MGLAIYVKGLWVEKGVPLDEEEASESGKYIIAYIGTIVDEKRQIVILNRDFERVL